MAYLPQELIYLPTHGSNRRLRPHPTGPLRGRATFPGKRGRESRVEGREPPRLALPDDLVDGGDDALPAGLREVIAVGPVRRPVWRRGQRARGGVQVPPALLHLEDLLEHEGRRPPRE